MTGTHSRFQSDNYRAAALPPEAAVELILGRRTAIDCGFNQAGYT